MMLHGSPGDPANWTQGAMADQTADAFAAQNGGKAPILVTPDIGGSTEGDTECVDGPRGNVETYLMTDVMNHIREKFNVATGPDSLAVVGLSTGATCSLMLARAPPRRDRRRRATTRARPSPSSTPVTRCATSSAATSRSSTRTTPPRSSPASSSRTSASGSSPGSTTPAAVAAQNQVAALTRAAGVQTCVGTMPGGHDFTVWTKSFQLSLPWLSGRLGLTPMPDPLPSECTSP